MLTLKPEDSVRNASEGNTCHTSYRISNHHPLSLLHLCSTGHCHCPKSPRRPNPPGPDHPSTIPIYLTRTCHCHFRYLKRCPAQNLHNGHFLCLSAHQKYWSFRK